MTAALQRLVRTTDAVLARAYFALFRERNALISFLFHSLFRDEDEIALDLVDPLQRTTVNQFRDFVEYYLNHGYRFVGPDDLLDGLDPVGRYILITFDDGYFNNARALPVLQEFGVPATFFVTSENVLKNKCFWWDVHYRERIAQGARPATIGRETRRLKTLTTERIEAELTGRFGPNAFAPRSDIDRPFSPTELREFAAQPLVHLGNHTANHAILTNYASQPARDQIAEAQDCLVAMTGIRPKVIAYPNGATSRPIVETCRELGLKVGFTVRPAKSPVPRGGDSPGMLQLGRFAPHGDEAIVDQCRTYRSDVQVYSLFREGYVRLLRGRPSG